MENMACLSSCSCILTTLWEPLSTKFKFVSSGCGSDLNICWDLKKNQQARDLKIFCPESISANGVSCILGIGSILAVGTYVICVVQVKMMHVSKKWSYHLSLCFAFNFIKFNVSGKFADLCSLP
jgi:hypothetical protein